MSKLLTALLAAGVLLVAASPSLASDGTFDRAIGSGVNPTATGASAGVCTVAAVCSEGKNGELGGEFVDPQGVATDAAGDIYVADANNQRVQKLDSQGRFLLAFGNRVDVVQGDDSFNLCTVASHCQAGTAGPAGGQFNLPASVATDAAGDVYVADAVNDRIQKFDSGGHFVRSVAGGGSLGGEVGFPVDVSTDAEGNIFVADERNNRITELDSTGAFVLAFGKDVVTGGGTGFEICTVAATCKVGGQGGLGGELTNPAAVATDGAGDIYVADQTSHRIEKFDSGGHFLLAFGKDVDAAQPGTGFEICTVAASCQAGALGDLPGEFAFPQGIATDTAGDLYVADSLNDRIQEFDSSGRLLRIIGTSGSTLGGELRDPIGLSTDPAGDLYVADQGNDRIQEFGDAQPAGTGGGGGGAGGGGSGAGGGAGSAGGPPSVPPHIAGLAQSHSSWRLGRKLATLARHVRRPPVGTRFSFVLDQPARVSLTFVREPSGHGAHRRSRPVAVGTVSLAGHGGRNRVAFQGRLSRGKSLRPGRYRMRIAAVNAAGQRSATRGLSFTIVP